ncbi:helix-turn-helix domain-containing protein [Amycolatopsis ultiminotia]|uniref:Helix-turn-helix domain-containing protein n=1 Tax=Amycolatopsis ultiminotia TaxID=543629 RepID=A0ABP6UU67_9PSEU
MNARAVAEPAGSHAHGASGGSASTERSRQELAAFRKLAAALAEERDLDSIFHLIVTTLSDLTGAARCSLHLLDRETGLFHGQAAHGIPEIDTAVKGLVSGMPGDDFTKEILETGEPVALINALLDPRSVHAAMRRWKARSVLGVPMKLRAEVIGILCLDTEDTASEFTQIDQELAVSFAELAATAINQVQLTSRLRASLEVQSKQLEMLQRARRMEGQLTDIVLRGRGIRELSEAIGRLLSKPCAIYDADFRCLADSGATAALSLKLRTLGDLRDHRLVAPVLESLRPGRPQCVPPLPQLGIDHRLMVSLIDLNGEQLGYVVVAEASGRFGRLDEVIVRRVAHNIALERSRSRLENDMEWRAVESLTGSLIRGEYRDVEARADALGVDLTARRAVCLVTARDASSPVELSPQHLSQLMTDQDAPSAALAAWLGSEIALILEVPGEHTPRAALDWLRARLAGVLEALSPDGRCCVAISSLVNGPRDDSRAYREAQQVLRCIREHLSDAAAGVLAADDIGVARVFLASAHADEARQFAQDTFGALLSERTVKYGEWLSTLESFLRLGRHVRDCADELGVHPNTVRYRLSGIERLTNLAVTTDDGDYMTAQVAMTIVRLSGRGGEAAPRPALRLPGGQ